MHTTSLTLIFFGNMNQNTAPIVLYCFFLIKQVFHVQAKAPCFAVLTHNQAIIVAQVKSHITAILSAQNLNALKQIHLYVKH